MEKNQGLVAGSFAGDFLTYLEKEQGKPDSPYLSVDVIKEERKPSPGKVAGGEIVLIVLALGADLFKDLIKDYLKSIFKKNNHSASYKIKNDAGEELTINFSDLTMEEIEEMVRRFRGNIVEINQGDSQGS
jgi:hypothetical protein